MLQMRYEWVVTEVINMVENYWFNKSNDMLCKARRRHKGKILKIEKSSKGENQITSFLIIGICFHFITTILQDILFSWLSETFCVDSRYIK